MADGPEGAVSPSRSSRPLLRALWTSHLESRHVARVLYGAIIGLALLLALEEHPPADAAVAATLLATAVAVGLAELYSEVLGTEARTHRRLDRGRLRSLTQEALATGLGVAFPALFFVLAAAGAMETHSAFTAAKWSGLGLITAYAFAASRLSGTSVPGSLLRAALAAAVATFLVLLKALVH